MKHEVKNVNLFIGYIVNRCNMLLQSFTIHCLLIKTACTSLDQFTILRSYDLTILCYEKYGYCIMST